MQLFPQRDKLGKYIPFYVTVLFIPFFPGTFLWKNIGKVLSAAQYVTTSLKPKIR